MKKSKISLRKETIITTLKKQGTPSGIVNCEKKPFTKATSGDI